MPRTRMSMIEPEIYAMSPDGEFPSASTGPARRSPEQDGRKGTEPTRNRVSNTEQAPTPGFGRMRFEEAERVAQLEAEERKAKNVANQTKGISITSMMADIMEENEDTMGEERYRGPTSGTRSLVLDKALNLKVLRGEQDA